MKNIKIDGYVGMSLLFTKFKTKKFINTADFNINKVLEFQVMIEKKILK